MGQIPLLFPTLVVLVVAALEWRHTRLISWLALAAGFVLLVAVFRHPVFSAEEIVAYGEAIFVTPISVARAVGAACFLYSVVRLIRSHEIPW